MPVRAGRCFNNWVMASNPPAEAPMPDHGKRISEATGGSLAAYWCDFN